MEEPEKKTRKSNSAKKSTSQKASDIKTTKKSSTTTNEKTSKTVKATTTAKTTKKASTKKEEKQPDAIVEKKDNMVQKIEKKPRKSTENKKLSEDKAKASKVTKTDKLKEEEKESVSDKKNPDVKSKRTNEKASKKEANDKIVRVDAQNTEKVVESKKTEKKIQNKDKQLKDEKQPEKSKKYIEISIGGIIAVIFIGLLVILNITLGKWAYNATKEKNTTKNTTIDANAETDEMIGTVLNHQNQIVNKLIDKIILPPNVTASIYKTGNFNEETIPNDLKLRIGWANLKEEPKFHAKQVTGESIIVVEKSAVEESIKEMFGSQTKYNNVSFDNTNVKEFSKYAEIHGIVAYDGDKYTGIVNEEKEEGQVAFIYQEIQKVVQYDSEIVILVKTAFVNQENNTYVMYQNYNSKFENKLLEITSEKLFENSAFNKMTGEGAIAISKNTALNDIRNELNTYKYTFAKDDSTGEYYLKEFGKYK